jgi:membrane protease YdiL (CAAX protease family)
MPDCAGGGATLNLLPILLVALVAVASTLNLLGLRYLGGRLRGRRPRSRLLAGLVAWLAEAVVVAAALLLVTGAVLPPTIVATAGIANQAWVEVTLAAAVVIALAVIRHWLGAPTFADVGLVARDGGLRRRDLVAGVLLGVGSAAVPLALGVAAGWIRVDGVAGLGDVAGALVLGAVLCAATGVVEELIFRGALFALVARVAGLPMAWAVSVTTFSLLHGLNTGSSAMGILGVAVAAVPLTLAFQRSGGLWLSIGFHASWNWALGCLYGFAVSGIGLTSLLQVTTARDAPEWATGGAFGPEAGLPGILAFILAGVGIWLTTADRAATRFRRAELGAGLDSPVGGGHRS